MSVFAGIDYSLTSPAICLWNSDYELTPSNCKIHYLTSIKKSMVETDNLIGYTYPEWTSMMCRYDALSSWSLSILSPLVKTVYIEGYSYGSVGKVFNLAENAGILKYSLWCAGIDVIDIPPTTIKKHATGKGNANKEKMNEQYTSEWGFDLREKLKMTKAQWNPSSDIIDSYYVLKTGIEKGL